MKLKSYTWSVSTICRLYRQSKINLEPPYQRRPAWRTRQREDLLDSIFNGIPLPAIIVYKTRAGRRTTVFEVMDGKQRVETILHFRYGRIIKGEGRLGFWLRRDQLKQRKRLFFKDLSSSATRKEQGIGVRTFLNYRVPVIEYSGELTGLAGQRIAQRRAQRFAGHHCNERPPGAVDPCPALVSQSPGTATRRVVLGRVGG